MLNRRAVLLAIGSGGLASLAAACQNSPEQREAELIREWFRSLHHVDVSDEEIKDIREYMRRPPLEVDPMVQPATLFDPEVDLG